MKKIMVLLTAQLSVFVFLSAQDAPVEQPVAEKPAVEAAVVSEAPVQPDAAKVDAVPAAKSKPEPKAVKASAKPAAETPVLSSDAAGLSLMDVSRDDFVSKRIPEIKIESVIPSVAVDVAPAQSKFKESVGSFFSFSKKTVDYLTKIAIVVVLIGIILVLKLRDRKKRRKVFRVKR